MKRAILLAGLLAVSCTVSPPASVPGIPAPVRACVAVHVHAGAADGPFVDGAAVTVGGLSGLTQGGGYFYFYPLTVGAQTIHVEKDGYVTLDQAYAAPAAAAGACDVDVVVRPIFVPLSPLHREGEFFKLANGARWFGIETSEFSIFARWLDGEDVRPVLQQRKDLGFNLLRVWTRFCHIPGIAGCSTLAKHPDLYDRLPAFLRLVNGYGFYVDLMAYVGPNNETDPQHWNRLCNAVRGPPELRGAVLLSLVNENDIHPIDLWPFQPCAGVLSSRGSVGSQAWPQDGLVWDWTEFHTNGAPEWQRKSGHNGMEIADAYHVPVIANENTSAQADPNPAHHEDAGAGDVLFVAGAAFHSSEGKDSVLFSEATAALARVFVKGTMRVPLYCRELGYERLDPGSVLRIYRRGGDDACRLEIRP